MQKKSFLFLLFAFCGFWLSTMLFFDNPKSLTRCNLILQTLILCLYNPTELPKNYRPVFYLDATLIVLLSWIINPQVWSVWLFLLIICEMMILSKSHLSLDAISKLLLFVAGSFYLHFVTNTEIISIQHDFASCYNYVEYILENNFMFWNENPLLTRPSYSSYHPILHFFIAAIFLGLAKSFGFSVIAANEGLQILTVSYMIWYGFLCAKILKLFNPSKIVYAVCLAFIVLFPAYFTISGFINNDCLLLPLQAGTVYYAILYAQRGKSTNLMLSVIYDVAASLTKLSGILVLPVVGICILKRIYTQKKLHCLKEILVWGFVLITGISLWPLYQHFVLGINNITFVPALAGVPLTSVSYWERFNPIYGLFYSDLFYQFYGVNLWKTLNQTALFGEYDLSLRGQQILFFIHSLPLLYKALSVIIFIALGILVFMRKTDFLFIVSFILLLSLLIGEISFVLIHPYMCNQDFRYIALLPLPWAMILAQTLALVRPFMKYLLVCLLAVFSFLATFIWYWAVL